jgi:hypothetical protein
LFVNFLSYSELLKLLCVCKNINQFILNTGLLEKVEKTEEEFLRELRKALYFRHFDTYLDMLGCPPFGSNVTLSHRRRMSALRLVAKTLAFGCFDTHLEIFDQLHYYKLIPYVIDFDQSGATYHTVLCAVAIIGSNELFKQLLKINRDDVDFHITAEFCLFFAIKHKRIEVVKTIYNKSDCYLKEGILVEFDVGQRNSPNRYVEVKYGGEVLISCAVKRGTPQILEHMLMCGSKVTRRDLLYVIRKGDLIMVKLLVAWGDLNFHRDCEIKTAVRYNHMEIVSFLEGMLENKEEKDKKKFERDLRCYRKSII